MARLVLLLLIAAVAYAVVRSWFRASGGHGRARAPDRPSEAIVRCAACGLNVPRSEALARGAQWYCSREHLERARPQA